MLMQEGAICMCKKVRELDVGARDINKYRYWLRKYIMHLYKHHKARTTHIVCVPF